MGEGRDFGRQGYSAWDLTEEESEDERGWKVEGYAQDEISWCYGTKM